MLKLHDLFDIDYSKPGANALASKILNKYSINKRELRRVNNEIEEIQESGGGGDTPSGGGDNWEVINAKAYGVEWRLFGNINDGLTRIGNLDYHKTLPCHQWKGCIANAENINYYLDEYDWSKKADGTASKLDGTDGTVRVEIPTFYYKSWSINDTNPIRRVMVSPEKIDDSWHEFPHILLDAYHATLDQTDTSAPKAVSVINTTPEFRGGLYRNAETKYDALLEVEPRHTDLGKAITNLTAVEMSNFAKNADAENLCYDIYKMVVFWMPVIEYATFNLYQAFNAELTADGYAQGGLSPSCLNVSWLYNRLIYKRYGTRTPNGFTNEFGNKSGAKLLYTNGEAVHNSTNPTDTTTFTATSDVWVNRYRGIENIFGDTAYILEGIIAGKAIYNTSNPSKFTNNPADRDKAIVGFGSQNFICYDFRLDNSCEMFAVDAILINQDSAANYTIYNSNNPMFGVAQMAGCSGTDDDPSMALVFVAGGCALAGVGGPAFLAGDDDSLALAAPGCGFRTLSRLNGDSKKLQYREVI